VIERGRALGVERLPANAIAKLDDSDRQPLPPGHRETWGAMNDGTSLEGVPFSPPGTIR
jgi:hypothetical protein